MGFGTEPEKRNRNLELFDPDDECRGEFFKFREAFRCSVKFFCSARLFWLRFLGNAKKEGIREQIKYAPAEGGSLEQTRAF